MSSLSDEESVYSPPPFTPPPLAPIPPPPPFSRTAMVAPASNGIQREISLNHYSNDPKGVGQRAYKYAGSVIPDSLENYTCISFQRQVEPILQDGPQCGLVALAMASSILKKLVSPEQLMELAQLKDFTKQGEMFSANEMECLAGEVYGCKTSVLDIRGVDGKWEFLNCLARGDLLLVPYDPDKNYVPVLKKGHKAHWALVTGFFASINEENILSRFQRSNAKQDEDVPNLYHCDTAPLPSNTPRLLPAEPNATPRALSANVPTRPQGAVAPSRAISARTLPPDPSANLPQRPVKENTKLCHNVGNLSHEKMSNATASRNPLEAAAYILVYANQGKSRVTGIWNAKTLVESCCNLSEIDPSRLAEGDNYKLPDKGIEEELCGKVVALHMSK